MISHGEWIRLCFLVFIDRLLARLNLSLNHQLFPIPIKHFLQLPFAKMKASTTLFALLAGLAAAMPPPQTDPKIVARAGIGEAVQPPNFQNPRVKHLTQIENTEHIRIQRQELRLIYQDVDVRVKREDQIMDQEMENPLELIQMIRTEGQFDHQGFKTGRNRGVGHIYLGIN